MKRVCIKKTSVDLNEEFVEVEDVSKYIQEQLELDCFPEDGRIYHNAIALGCDVTPHDEKSIQRLQKLEGDFYVVLEEGYDPVTIAYLVVMALVAAFSVYTYMTMPKPQVTAPQSANNELAQRSNRLRVGGRIPEILGTLRCYPDLIAQVFTWYDNNIEIEECIMCIGMGYYQIGDVKDGDTDVGNIDGMSASIYEPNTSLIGPTAWRIGGEFTRLPFEVYKSESINGQSLKRPNEAKLTSSEIWFEAPNYIKCSTAIDFTQGFVSGDNIAIQNASYGVSDVILTGEMLIKQNNHVVIETTRDIDDVNKFTGLQLTGAIVEIITQETVSRQVASLILDQNGNQVFETVTEVIEKKETRDLSGQYTVAAIQKTTIPTGFHYDIALTNPHYVNPSWALLNDDYLIIAGALLNKNIQGITLNGAYTISSISPNVIALVDPVAINTEWEKLYTLPNKSTSGQNVEVQIDSVSNKWIGWFNLDMRNAEGMSINLTWPQGLYWQSKSGRRDPTETKVLVEYQQIDETGTPTGAVQQSVLFFREFHSSQFGRTLEINFNFIGRFRFRACLDWYTDDSYRGEVKIKDVFAFAKSDKDRYENITIVRTITPATDGALSVKERKLNCLVTRKLPIDGTGDLVATRDAGQALIYLALNEKNGRRTIDEVDIEQIKNEVEQVKSYFGSEKAAEFCYTIDDTNLSFEEIAGMIASAIFCEPYRFGSKLRLKFEKPQEIATLLFNHRNKVPGSEKQTITSVVDKYYDGIELEYTDPLDDARIKYHIYYDVETETAIEGNGALNPMTITTTGIRNHEQAKTRAWREWNKLQYRKVTTQFEALDESNLLTRNSKLLNADNCSLRAKDGDVLGVNGLVLTLSQDNEMPEDISYKIFLQMRDGTVDTIPCEKIGPSQVLLSRPPRMQLVVEHDRYARATYLIVSELDDRKITAFMLTEMNPATRLTNNITAVNYDDRYYEKDHSFF
ncbi:host specificity factor TipJ family phage tail protein [Acinetobacter rudis]|uniref:host specificity factor TipJ family phage tail protein n=1 Tax=Acinetobacter rudis TaxID=632955 RepID=UPI00280CCB38|nr:host specificity factor TipJ family phage tail protein [Acinetobacter rudis]MDQ8953473.1 host specificity factor TipJ family phage tail protein [Acinetobacter rudis]